MLDGKTIIQSFAQSALPTTDVTATQKRLDDFFASVVFCNQLALAVVVDQERLIETGLDSVQRSNPGYFLE
ncbi:MAG: hypothetical protein V9H26_09875 [Verrucomicrobiota bacterium]